MVLCAITVSLTYGQKPKFKKVEKAELESTFCAYDSLASAEYLYRGCRITYEYDQARGRFDIIYEFHNRIKIYNEDGIKYADQTYSYYRGNNNAESEKITDLQAYTFNLENGKIKDTKLDKGNVFEEKINKYYTAKKFAMPAIQAGSVIDVKYKLRSPYYFRIDEFYFQKDIPVAFAEFEAQTPEYFNYNYNIKGLVSLKMEEDRKQGVINYSYVEDTSRDYRVNRQRKYERITYNVLVKKYSAHEIVGIKEEPFVYTMDNFKSSIKLELLFTKFPQSGIKYYTKTWNDIAKSLSSNDGFGDQLKKNHKAIKELLKQVESMPDNEKIGTIYHTIQQNYTWNGNSSASSELGIKKLLEDGVGNSADLNLLLVNVLQKAGINAFPLVYKRRYSGYLNITNSTIADLNYVIAIIPVEDGIVYLDATDDKLTVDMLPARALNLRAVVVMGEEGQEIPLHNHNKGSKNQVYELNYSDTGLSGSYRQMVKGYHAYNARSNYSTSEEYINHLQKENIKLSNTEIKEYSNITKSISLSSDIELNGYTQEIDGKIFIDLMVGQDKFKNYFEADERNFAIFLDSKSSQTNLIKIKIPEGYQIESMPETLNISTPEGLIKYQIDSKIMGEEIVITIRSSFNKTIINPEYYESVKLLFEQVEAKSKEKIVLTKV